MRSYLNPGEFLVRSDATGLSQLLSANGKYQLILQPDGNLVLYRSHDHKALWATGTNGKAVKNAVMQSDGNFVLYGFNEPLWASNTNNKPGSFLVMQDDGNAVIYVPGPPVWATNTAQ